MKLEERYWSKVDKGTPDECWEWIASKNNKGYGQIKIRSYKLEFAHRLSWIFANGEIGDKQVLHSCDNPACVNPKHLFLGTHADNMKDKAKKGRSVNSPMIGNKHPLSKLTENDVRYIRKSSETNSFLAKKYNVRQQTIWKIRKRNLWKHI